jgi:hypothetical protein
MRTQPSEKLNLKPNVLISLTSIPRRLDSALLEVLATLKRQRLKCSIIINIPVSYRKWGLTYSIPSDLRNQDNVVIFSPKVDYGPATKLLGALEYIQERPEITHIITVDDDVLIHDPGYLKYLSKFATVLPDCAVTFGGIKLDKFPFKCGDGLIYNNQFIFVDIPAGYKGVLYPVERLRGSRMPFEFFSKLPSGIFNEDDAYFGVLLSVLNIPLFAIPNRPGGSPIMASKYDGGSAVAELANKERVQNEMEIFQYAVSQGYLRTPKDNDSRQLNGFRRYGVAAICAKELLQCAVKKMSHPARMIGFINSGLMAIPRRLIVALRRKLYDLKQLRSLRLAQVDPPDYFPVNGPHFRLTSLIRLMLID